MLRLRPSAILAVLVLGEPNAGEPARAEYAVRWAPAQGGPRSAREVLDVLGAPDVGGKTYEVRYFVLAPPDGAPADSVTILRQRIDSAGRSVLRLKYRRQSPVSGPWACPAGNRYRRDEEVDVSFSGSGEPTRVFAYSCTLNAAEPPASFAAAAMPCASRMTRYEFGPDKIEEWTLPGGDVQLEVSRSAGNDARELAQFADLVRRLRDLGIRPTDQSKTELGSVCAPAR